MNAAPDGIVAGQAFFGPKETGLLDRYGFEKTLQLGTFGIIARFFLVALTWINGFTHNWGWAIIVLTIVIKVALYPLQHKWMLSMRKIQKVQPKMEAIKARYKKHRTDPEQRQKMNAEVMKLYQQEGINPAGGCLPMLIQLPIFYGFYAVLQHAIELRGAAFGLWIHDLSEGSDIHSADLDDGGDVRSAIDHADDGRSSAAAHVSDHADRLRMDF